MGMRNKIDPNIIPEYIVGVEEGLERAIKWYREEMKGIENNE